MVVRTARLAAAAVYTPFDSGVYRVSPGLYPLTRDFGNGPLDGRVFQIDEEFPRFRANKLAVRGDIERYYGELPASGEAIRAACRCIVEQLAGEYPDLFTFDGGGLECRLTGDTLRFDDGFGLIEGGGYLSGFDALANQVPEDLAVVEVLENGSDRLAAVHVTAPSYWDPSEKLGKDFIAVHEPVPGMEGINRKAGPMVAALARGGRYQRFAWSITTDDRLDHHTTPATGFEGDGSAWHGRAFDPTSLRLFVRTERQTIVGLPEVNGFLFTIRPCLLDCAMLGGEERLLLAAALETMTVASREYKGVAERFDEIVAWLSRD